MRIRNRFRVTCFSLGCALALAGICGAQVSTSSISGTVTDKTGASVARAKVVATNEATGVAYETTTSTSGEYNVASVPPGKYTVTVTMHGFREFTSLHNELLVGAPLVVDAMLEIGEMSEVVRVESSYAKVETTNAMVSDVVTRREVRDLPLNGRNPLNLIALEPGIVQRTNNAAGSGTHVFGSRDRAHNVTVDGIDANESSVPNPQNNILRLNPDNVQEYRVVTHNATPEYGRNSGANVAIATRSGSNDLHGDAFWFHRNTVLNANERFNNAKRIAKPTLLLNQPGGTLGGPIIKDRTFFFGSVQINRIRLTEPIAQAFGVPKVYTPTMKSGVFRYVKGCVNPAGSCSPGRNGPNDFTANSPALVDANGNLLPGLPLCTSATDTNCIASYNIFDPGNVPTPGSGADQKIAAMINTFPLPNSYDVGDGLNFAGYVRNVPSAFDGTHLLFRLDHKFDENNNIFVRYIHSNNDTTRGDLLNGRPSIFPGFPPMGEVFRVGRNLAVSYRRVLSPTVVNEFTTGFSYFRFFFTWGESNPNFGDLNKVPPYGQQCAGSSFININTPFCDTPRTQRGVSTLQWIDNLSVVRGSHTLRTGINFRFYRHNDARGLAGGQNVAPTISFNGENRLLVQTPTGAAGWKNLPPPRTVISSSDRPALLNAIAELSGLPAQLSQAFAANLGADVFGGLQFGGTRAKQYDWYGQDEWKVTRNLTMTYGLRWEFNQAATDCCVRVLVPDKAVDGLQGTVTFRRAERWFQRNNATALAPRVSFAWNPRGGKSVVRGGYGMAFDTISTFQITAIGGQVPGEVLNCRLALRDFKDPITGELEIANTFTNGCTLPSNITSAVAGGFPLLLALPSAKPSGSFSPAPQAFGAAPGAAAFDQNLKVPTVHEWSLSVQRELPWGFVGQVGYIGKRGMRLYRAYDINQPRADRPEFVQDFLVARNNVGNGCRPDGTNCPTGVTGTTPDLLLTLTNSTQGDENSLLNKTSNATFIRNGVGDLALRIDQFAFNTFSGNATFGPNYFRPNPQFTRIFYFDSGGDSYYHGAVAQLRRRFEKGLTMGLAYTFGKSMDDMSVDPVGASSGGAISAFNSRTPTDVRNFRLDRSRSDFDNRHVLTVDWLYDLPFGHEKRWGRYWRGFANQAFGGWSMTGIYLYESGEPFTINSGSRTQNGFKVSRAELVGPMPSTDLKSASSSSIVGPVLFDVSPVLVPDPRDPRFKTCKQAIGTQSYFCIPAASQTGMGRNTAQGPGFWNLDFGISKNFPVSEAVKLEFRAEFFNIFNHPNYENPRNATDGSPTLTSSLFGRTCCVTSSLPNSTAVIADGEPNRVIQFALRVNF